MISIQNLALRAGTKPLLDSANLTIHPGQKIGLVGKNGAGKSTFFKAVLGEVSIDAGEIKIPNNWQIGYVEQETNELHLGMLDFVCFGDTLYFKAMQALSDAEKSHDNQALVSVYDQIEHIQAYEVPLKAKQMLFGLGFHQRDFDKKLSEFSGGWQVRLKLARALMQRSDLLLLDEPTNHLDIEAVTWLELWLKAYQGAILVISHDRSFLDEVVQGIAEIDQQKIQYYSGNFAAFERQRHEQLMQQQSLHDKQKQQMQHLKTFISRFKAKASKAKQAQSRVKALERMEQVAAVQASTDFHFAFSEPKQMPDPMLEVQSVNFAYNQKNIIDSVNLVVRSGDRIGLVGVNGSGKTTLLKLLVGDLKPHAGKIQLSKGLKIGYFSQHQLETLRPEWSPLQHLLAMEEAPSDQEARDFLGQFGFSNQQALDTIENFSGGEKARLALALICFQEPNLIILDEPTNHLDMETRDALEMAINDFTGGVIIVSHDKQLLNACVDQFWWVHQGAVELYFGSLDEYLQEQMRRVRDENRMLTNGVQNAEKNEVNKKAIRQANAQVRKQLEQQLKPLKQKLKKLESQLEKSQIRLDEIHALMEDPELYDAHNKEKLEPILLEEATLKKTIEANEEQWLELEEEMEAIRLTVQA